MVDDFPFMLRVSEALRHLFQQRSFSTPHIFSLAPKRRGVDPKHGGGFVQRGGARDHPGDVLALDSVKEKSPPTCGASAARWRAAMCAPERLPVR